MEWLRRMFGRDMAEAASEPLNLDGILAEGLRDRAAARKAIDRLNHERTAILKSQRALEKRSNALSSRTVKGIIRGPGLPELRAQQLSQAMRQANDPGSGLNSSAQLVALEERLAAIDRVRAQLYAVLDRLV